ncbi:MAG: hypothetical protein WC030_03890 [Candidatus Paceibacterota bacterium]
MATTKNVSGKVAAGVGAGLAAVGAAAAAGYYYYASPAAKKHRKIAAKWATDMKKEAMRDAKSFKEDSEKGFAKIVDTVAKGYKGAKAINAADVQRAAMELKSNWDMIQREMKRSGKKTASKTKAVVKKAATKSKQAVGKVVAKAKKAAK